MNRRRTVPPSFSQAAGLNLTRRTPLKGKCLPVGPGAGQGQGAPLRVFGAECSRRRCDGLEPGLELRSWVVGEIWYNLDGIRHVRLNNRYVEGAVLVAALARDVEHVTRKCRLLK